MVRWPTIEPISVSPSTDTVDADGNVVNATMDWLELDEPLAPGDESEFEGYFLDHFEDAEYFEVYVTAYTAEALGQ